MDTHHHDNTAATLWLYPKFQSNILFRRLKQHTRSFSMFKNIVHIVCDMHNIPREMEPHAIQKVGMLCKMETDKLEYQMLKFDKFCCFAKM